MPVISNCQLPVSNLAHASKPYCTDLDLIDTDSEGNHTPYFRCVLAPEPSTVLSSLSLLCQCDIDSKVLPFWPTTLEI